MLTIYIAKFNDDRTIPLVRLLIADSDLRDLHNIDDMFYNGTFEFTGDRLKIPETLGAGGYRILAERRVMESIS